MKKSIMIVEDESIVAHDLQLALENAGFNVVHIVDSGEAAIESIRKEPVDLVLMDIKLSGEIDGIEAAAIIKTLVDIPIVFLTAFNDDETLLRATETMPFGYIIKPFNDKEIHLSLELALYKHSIQKNLRAKIQSFQDILNTIKDYIIVADMSGKIFYTNTACEKELNFGTGENIFKYVSEIFSYNSNIRKECNYFNNLVKLIESEDFEEGLFYCSIGEERKVIEGCRHLMKNDVGGYEGYLYVLRNKELRNLVQKDLENKIDNLNI